MRVLIDECLPRQAKRFFTGHVVATVPERGWGGYKNGRLIAAIKGNFDFLVTGDGNLQFQQNTVGLPFGVIVLVAPTNRMVDLGPVLAKVLPLLTQANVGKVIRVAVDGTPGA